MYILDTNHISLLEFVGTNPIAQRLLFRLARLKPKEKVTTIITFEEQVRGWLSVLARSRSLDEQVDAYRRLSRLLQNYLKVEVLEFDRQAAAEFQRLKQARIRIGTMDLKIAAIALAHGATVLTRNLKDFSRVSGLRVEDWTA
jgi:tRNA(fMet)-specific endonuclease VapC